MMRRMGARVSLSDDRRPFAKIDHIVREVDESGREVLKRIPSEPGLIVSVLHFVDLDDGRRLTTEAGRIDLVLPCSPPDLREVVREFIFEEEMREVAAEEMADEPLWEEMLQVLRKHDGAAVEGDLASLPFVLEVDDAVIAQLSG